MQNVCVRYRCFVFFMAEMSFNLILICFNMALIAGRYELDVGRIEDHTGRLWGKPIYRAVEILSLK